MRQDCPVPSRPTIAEGLWFAVPLRDSGFAVGVVARANPNGVLLGYFFGPRRVEPPTLDQVSGLTTDQALWVSKFGYLGLRNGLWPVLGRLDNWRREDWPMPEFVRYEELTGRSFRVIYDDLDPNKIVREVQVAPGAAEQGPHDGSAGAGFVEIRLTNLLSA